MKNIILTVLVILFGSNFLLAQRDNASLLVQSADGRTVKLVWFFKSWNSDITGFDIKRKEGLKDWEKLNREPILPGISIKKKLAIVDADKNEESELKAHLFKLLDEHKIQETSDTIYLYRLNSDNKAAQEISDSMARDYDLAVLSGFGYVDHTVTNKTAYEYGLFIRGTDILLDSVIWNYGEIPDLNMVHEITSKATQTGSGITLMWNADIDKMKGADVAGFNIYREGIRLNPAPIVAANSKEPSEFTWFDRTVNNKNMSQYSISAESIFGIEGIIKPYTYNPTEHPTVYKKAGVTDVASLGYYFKEGISVRWTFPAEDEHFIKGFYLEKNNMPEGYRLISPLLDPSARVFTDKSGSPVSGYISFRVVAVYNDKTRSNGVERLYSYFPVRQPPSPQNVQVRNKPGDKKNTVTISWDPAMSGDSVTDYYRVYVADPLTGKFTLITGAQQLKTNSYAHEAVPAPGGSYRFFVSAVNKSNTEGIAGDTVALFLPSTELPVPVIARATPSNDGVTIHWLYPEIADLKGFRLYRNKQILAGENVLGKNAREYLASDAEPGATYDFTIVAVAENGVESVLSAPVTVTLPKAKEK